MNADRRKQITALIDRLSDLQSDIELVRDEEQEYFDNMPESFQNGDKGELAEEAISALEEAAGRLNDASA